MTEHKSLLAAILAVQKAAPTLPKDKTNPHFKSKFTPLDTIVETVGPILGEHGLVWMTLPVTDEHGRPALQYRLAHAATGDDITETMPLLLTKEDPQGQGSAITYARRYALCAVLNLVGDDDDDGQAASGGTARKPSKVTGTPNGRGATESALKNLHGNIRRSGVQEPQLRQMVAETGAKDVAIEEGWALKLTARQVSTLIDRLKDGDLPPAPEPVPAGSDAGDDELFTHPPAGVKGTPWEEAA